MSMKTNPENKLTVFDIFSVHVKGLLDVEMSLYYQSTVAQQSETITTEEITREFTVGANSIGEMFRLIYKGPGVTYETGTISTDSSLPLDEVFITCEVKQTQMLKDFQVVYTDESIERPDNVITDTRGYSPDINRGFGGRRVWLVPVWTTKMEEAATNIQLVVQREYNGLYQNLAEGAGGDYRYLKMLKDSNSYVRINRVGLLRSPNAQQIYDDRQKYGWDNCTFDINVGRLGDWLHLCWNVLTIT